MLRWSDTPMMNDGFVDTYIAVCRDLDLDDNESRRLWLTIVKEIQRVAQELSDPDGATEDEIRAVCDRLGVPSLRRLGVIIRSMREKTEPRAPQIALPIAARPVQGGFTGVTRDDRIRVVQLAQQFLV